MPAPARRWGHAFTLIELLVVISIIGILVAMLLPALGAARAQALRLKDSAQIRGMVQGYTMYASDHKGELATVVYSLGTDPIWYVAPPYHDFRPLFKDYNLYPLTSNPVLGTPRLDDPANTASILALPWFYFPAIPSGRYECTVPGWEITTAIPPIRLDRGRSNHVMVQDQISVDLPLRYYANLIKNTSLVGQPANYTPGTPSHGQFIVPALTDVYGAYTGTYDGAVTLRKTDDMRWAAYLPSTAYSFGHFQPE